MYIMKAQRIRGLCVVPLLLVPASFLQAVMLSPHQSLIQWKCSSLKMTCFPQGHKFMTQISLVSHSYKTHIGISKDTLWHIDYTARTQAAVLFCFCSGEAIALQHLTMCFFLLARWEVIKHLVNQCLFEHTPSLAGLIKILLLACCFGVYLLRQSARNMKCWFIE